MTDIDPTCCQVCTDPAAAFYCGAQVCEACKKFFIRSWKHSTENNYVCLQDKKCILTKESRKHCACCRYEKCLQLKMYLPGGPRVSQQISRVPCRICAAPASGFHFGAITCEGCKGFFRRRCHDNRFDKFKCNENNSCPISASNRSMCKACRLKKCLDVGMVAEKCRIGRQPNIIIHKTKLELQKILQNQLLMNSEDKDYFPEPMNYETSREQKIIKSSNLNDNEILTTHNEFVKQENDFHIMGNDKSTINTITSIASSIQHDLCHNNNNNNNNNVNINNNIDNNLKFKNPSSTSIDVYSNITSSSSSSLQQSYLSAQIAAKQKQIFHSNYLTLNNYSTKQLPFNNNYDYPYNAGLKQQEYNLDSNSSYFHLPRLEAHDVTQFNSNACFQSSNTLLTNVRRTRGDLKIQNAVEVTIHHAMTSSSSSTSSSPSSLPGMSDDISAIGEGGVVKLERAEHNFEFNGKIIPKSLGGISFGQTANDIIGIMANAFTCLTPILTRYDEQAVKSDMEYLEMWQRTMKRFEFNAKASLAFARKVPGFKVLPLSSQIELIQYSMCPVILGTMSLNYDHINKSVNFFMWDNLERELILTSFPFFKLVERAVTKVGEIVKSLKIDNIELSLVLSIFLLSTSNNFEYKELLIDALKFYVTNSFGSNTQRHNQILMALRALVLTNHLHKEMVVLMRKSRLPIPQLFEETFMNDNVSEIV